MASWMLIAQTIFKQNIASKKSHTPTTCFFKKLEVKNMRLTYHLCIPLKVEVWRTGSAVPQSNRNSYTGKCNFSDEVGWNCNRKVAESWKFCIRISLEMNLHMVCSIYYGQVSTRHHQAHWNKVWRQTRLQCRQNFACTTCTLSILLYGSETWTLLQEDLGKLEVFHMRSQRMILIPRDTLAWLFRNTEVLSTGPTFPVFRISSPRDEIHCSAMWW